MRINIPENVAHINGNPFVFCTNLEEITVADGNATYHSASGCLIETRNHTLIAGCKNSKIPSYVMSIGNAAFHGCKDLTNIEIPESVASIKAWAFAHCSGLTSIKIPGKVSKIDDCAFYGTGLMEVVLPDALSVIGDCAFASCSFLTKITIPNSVTSIENYAFSSCTKLSELTIPNSVTNIGIGVIAHCKALRSLTVMEENEVYRSENNCIIEKETDTLILGCLVSKIPMVSTIGEYAFYGAGISVVVIPQSVRKIGKYAFEGCNITSATFGNG